MSTQLATKMNSLRGTILLLCILSVQLVSSADPQATTTYVNYQNAHRCCAEPNILDKSCRNSSTLICSSYLLDPEIDPIDLFNVTDEGVLIPFQDHHLPVQYDEYCVAYSPRNHSAYVARICFAYERSLEYSQSMFTLKGTMALVSVFFIVITLYVYHVIVMRDTQDRVVRYALYCLLGFFLFLGATQMLSDLLDRLGFCTLVAFLVHFSAISYFSWLNMIMANMWKTVVVPRWAIDERKWYRWNHIYAWSIPIVIELVMIFGHFTRHATLDPRIGIIGCWFESDRQSLGYLFGPITVLLVINVIFFIWTCIVLHRYGSDLSPDRRNALKYRVSMYTKFFLLVGLTWIFEIASFFAGDHFIWIIFDSINALHGLVLFLILVVFRSRVKKELAGKRLCCCLHAPEHWRDNVDVEHQRLNENDDEDSDPYTNDLIIKG